MHIPQSMSMTLCLATHLGVINPVKRGYSNAAVATVRRPQPLEPPLPRWVPHECSITAAQPTSRAPLRFDVP